MAVKQTALKRGNRLAREAARITITGYSMKKILLSLCLAAILALGAAGSASAAKDSFVVGISTPTADHGWTGGIVWWAEQAAVEFGKKHPNIKFIFKASDSDKEQAAHVEAMHEGKLDALVILPHRPAPLTTVLNKVHKSGAFIVVVDRSIPKVPKDIYLAGDNFGFGHECGLHMANALGGKGKILVMEGIPCEGNTLRVNGFKKGIQPHPEIVVLDSQPAYWSPPKAYELMLQYLQKYPQIDAVWCGDDDVLETAVQAYKESGRKDIKFFLGGGGSKKIIKMILDNDPLVHATVTYPPNMVHEGVRLAVERLTKGATFPKEIVIPSELVTRENAQAFYYPGSIY